MLSKPDLMLASLTFRSHDNRTKDCGAAARGVSRADGLPVAIVAQRACHPVRAGTTNCQQQAQGRKGALGLFNSERVTNLFPVSRLSVASQGRPSHLF
jgi:hypothetical protein